MNKKMINKTSFKNKKKKTKILLIIINKLIYQKK